jgi:uncharacterized protein YggT (Ycf19 family)
MIRLLLETYTYVLIADIISSCLPQYRNQQFVVYIRIASDITCGPIRKLLKNLVPEKFPVDLSPIIVIVGINVLKGLWYSL